MEYTKSGFCSLNFDTDAEIVLNIRTVEHAACLHEAFTKASKWLLFLEYNYNSMHWKVWQATTLHINASYLGLFALSVKQSVPQNVKFPDL